MKAINKVLYDEYSKRFFGNVNGSIVEISNGNGGTGGGSVAMLSGTFAAAWAHSKAVTTPFCWLWTETVDNSPVCKPIWHVGNSAFVDAAGAVVSVDTLPSAPAAPTMTMSETTDTPNEFPESGGTLELSAATGANIYYELTTDGTDPADPTDASTQYNGTPISISVATKIKAIAKDNYGYSAVATATYTIAVAKIKVKVNADTTMSLGDTGLTAIPLSAANNNGVNEFTINDINTLAGTSYTSFADHEFASLSFGDNTKIVEFDGGGVKIKSLKAAFQNASAVTSVKGIVMCATSTGSHIDGNIDNAFNTAKKLEYVQLSGAVSYAARSAFSSVGFPDLHPSLDIASLVGSVSNMQSIFNASRFETIDIRGFDTSGMSANDNYGSFTNAFSGCTNLIKLIIGNLADPKTLGADTFANTTGITILECTTTTPPTLKESGGWLEALVTANPTVTIVVPDGCLGTTSDSTKYAGANGWKNYSSQMVEKSNYNNN